MPLKSTGGSGAVAARCAACVAAASVAVFTSMARATAPPHAPMSVGQVHDGVESGRVTTAASPIAVKTASPAMPYASRRMATIPITAANANSSTRTPPTRKALSFVPNVEVAQSFTGSGVLPITH